MDGMEGVTCKSIGKKVGSVLGASTGDPTHDKVIWERPVGQGESGLEGPPGPA